MVQTTINLKPIKSFKPLFEINKGTVICMGGRGGGKSISVSKWVIARLFSKQDARGILIRDEQVKIKQSILNDVRNIALKVDEKANGLFSKFFVIQDRGIKNKKTGEDVVFPVGMRTSTKTQTAAQKSLSRIDFVIIEEAEDIRDEEAVNRLMDTLIRFKDAVIIFILNTPDINHWIIKRYFNLQDTDYEGYFKPIPKKLDDHYFFLVNYSDNEKLAPEAVSRYESYGDPNSYLYNKDWYLNQILGLVTTGRRGKIFNGWEVISDEEFDNLEYMSMYGLDFGYSQDPAALIEIKKHNNKLYLKELIYEKGLTNPRLADKINSLGIKSRIIADSAEPKSIEELRQLNIDVIPAKKGPDSINHGIQKIKNMKVFYTSSSKNLENEYISYCWDQDKDKKFTDKPIDKYNHLIDALRYSLSYDNSNFDISII